MCIRIVSLAERLAFHDAVRIVVLEPNAAGVLEAQLPTELTPGRTYAVAGLASGELVMRDRPCPEP